MQLSLVEIESSAGLNLLWDRYGYNYGEGQKFGDTDSPVQIASEFRGSQRPFISALLPPVAFRVGMDLDPIDVHDPEAVLWFRALVWPERQDEVSLLVAAIQVAKRNPPAQIAGDVLHLLPEVLGDVPKDTALCIYNTHTLNQFSPEDRDRVSSMIVECGRHRDLYWISVEGFTAPPQIQLASFEDGRMTEKLLGYCDAHGRWLEWREDN